MVAGDNLGETLQATRRRLLHWAGVSLVVWNLPLTTGCDRAPPEPEDPRPAPQALDAEAPDADPEPAPGGAESDASSACVVPLVEPPPPEVSSLSDCPEDPEGRPQMPIGKVSFPDAPGAPTLDVELALIPDHQAHGLMYRPTLADDEGMLFSWPDERHRFFWMKNTCLALDMLFIARDGTIAGILENVPPWNERPQRTVACPVSHVLEVRAGWTRSYGVEPGQRMHIGPAASP